MRRAAKNAAVAVLALSLAITSSTSTAGLFGAIGHALGIGGAVGDVLNFGDSLLPGGGGVTDSILGAPGNALFGSAINNWGDTNERLIEKMGETNDKTVIKLLEGLDKVSVSLTSGLKEDVNALDAALSASVATLDDALERNIERLDSSLTDQTGRLDTVFQKQVSTIFFLGRVLLTVAIVGGLAITIYVVALAPTDASLATLWKERRSGMWLAVSTSVALLVLTWLAPDPSRLKALAVLYQHSYDRALNVEDFRNAHYNASQLSLLSPESSEFRAWSLKTEAFRDLAIRPTSLLSEDGISGIFVKLAQANEYEHEGTGKADSEKIDPDVGAAFALLVGLKAEREIDYMNASLLSARALGSFKGGPLPHTIQPLGKIIEREAFELRQTAVEAAFVSEVVLHSQLAGDSAERKAMVDQYRAFVHSTSAKPSSSYDDSALRVSTLSSLSELGDTVDEKLKVRAYYQHLTSLYFNYLELRASAVGADQLAIGKASQAYCDIFQYYLEWEKEMYPRYGDNLSFVTNLFAGPFMILAHARKLNTVARACPIPDSDLDKIADQQTRWIVPLSLSKLQRTAAGATLLRDAVKVASTGQDSAFSQFEQAFSVMTSLPGKDVSTLSQQQRDTFKLVVQRAAVLGLYAASSDSKVPAVYKLYEDYGSTGILDYKTWSGALLAFLESKYGT